MSPYPYSQMLAEYWGKTAKFIYLSPFAGRAIVLILFWERLSPGLLDSISQKKKTQLKKTTTKENHSSDLDQ